MTLACGLLLAASLAGCGVARDDSPPRPGIGGASAGAGEGTPSTATKDTVRIPGENPTEDAAGAAAAAFPGTAAATRPQAVTVVGENDWQGAIAASVLVGEPVGAPILLSAADELPAVSAAELADLAPTGAELLDGAKVVRIGAAPGPEGLLARTAAGPDPYTRAAAIDRLSSAARGEPSGHVIIASGEQPAWAMPAAPWAARSGHAVLFTQANSLPPATIAALKEHEDANVHILGPNTVIGPAVERQLRGLADRVERIEAPTPVANAIEFARHMRGSFGWGFIRPGHNFTVASVTRPMDVAAAATFGGNGVFAPLLLVDEAARLPAELDGYLLDVQPGYSGNPSAGVFNSIFVLGDEAAISGAAQARLDEISELVPVDVSDR